MWCPSVSLSVWANAWLAGSAAPDDVLDVLSLWAPTHSVLAVDAVAAGRTGLPWPDPDDTGAITLLQTVRAAAGNRSGAQSPLSVVLPVPGDVRGLIAGTPFQQDALAAGEAIVVTDPSAGGAAIGLVPEFEYADNPTESGEVCGLSWTVYSLQIAPVADYPDLGEAEYALRSAVHAAAETLGGLGRGRTVDADPRGVVEQLLEASQQHRVPAGAPPRALRVLERAAHVDAIITVSAGLMPIAAQTSSEAQLADGTLRPLAAVVRTARLAVVNAILQSAWQS